MSSNNHPTSAGSSHPESSPPPSLAAPVEVVRKVYVRDIHEKERVHTVFKVTRKDRQVARSGKAFLAVGLADKTGEIDARIFDRVDERDGVFKVDDYVLVQGQAISFHGKPQVVIELLERLDPEPLDPREFQAPPLPGAGTVAQIREIVERVQDRFIRALLLAFLDDPQTADGLRIAPAAKNIHHAYKGGLADHILSVMRLALRVAEHYPMLDRDLLIAGALLHDIGKVQELSYEHGSFDYTDEGRLVGHLVMAAQRIRQYASRMEGFPPLLEQHLTHLVLAHHGQLEYGSPKTPMTLEALAIHLIDSLDSRIACWLEAMARDGGGGDWAKVNRPEEMHLWKGPVPTVRHRSPIEGRRRHKEPREPRERHKEPREPRERHKELKGERKPHAPAPEAQAAPEAQEAQPKAPAEGPRPLSFKPLADLVPPSAEPESSAPEGSAPPAAPSEPGKGEA